MTAQQPHSGATSVNRRTALRATALMAGGVAAGVALAGCTTPTDRAADPEAQRLRQAAAQALADADAARGLAVTDGAKAVQLQLISEQRTTHARALSDELSRFLGSATSVSASATPPSAPPTVTRASLAAQLAHSARSAGEGAVSASGYQAALLGSVAAATRVHAEVILS